MRRARHKITSVDSRLSHSEQPARGDRQYGIWMDNQTLLIIIIVILLLGGGGFFFRRR